MVVQAVIFDLDGTLIDSAPELTAALNDLLVGDLGRRALSAAEVQRMIGEGAGMLVQRALAATGRAERARHLTARFLELYDARAASQVSAYPGVQAALEALEPRFSLALCTNKPLRPTLAILEQLGWRERFAVVVGGDSLETRKPDPGPLHHILSALGVAPAQAVMVGDSPADAGAAHAAGVPFVAMRYGYSREPVETLGAQVILDDLRELLPWLEAQD